MIIINSTMNSNISHVTEDSPGHGMVSSATIADISYLVTFVQPPIMICGISTNVMNVIVFFKLGLKDSISLCFFVLALVDIASLFLMTPSVFFIIFATSLPESWRVDGNVLGLMVVYYYTLFYDISQAITTFAAIQKCCCVTLPFKFKNTFTRSRSAFILCALSMTCIVLYIPMLVSQGLMETHNLIKNTTFLAFWTSPDREQITKARGVYSVMITTGCQVTVVISLILITSGLRKSLAFRMSVAKTCQPKNKCNEVKVKDPANLNQSFLNHKELQAVKSTAFISALFVLCNTPKLLIQYAILIQPEFNMFRRYEAIFSVANDVRFCTEALNAASNMFIYLYCNRKFRKVFITCSVKSHQQSKS